jgi:single-strand DNA-binding protein
MSFSNGTYFQATIVGNLGRDPEMSYLPSGSAVTRFSLATNEKYTSGDGQKVEETGWHSISVFGKLAEICNEYLSKGRKVLVVAKLRPDRKTGGPRLWTGQDGQPRASFEFVAKEVIFLDRGGERVAAGSDADVAEAESETEIPF